MKFNAKKLLASVMALSMTASLAVPSVFAATDGATETTLPTTHIADLFDGHNVDPTVYDANKFQTWWSEINAATGNTRVTKAHILANDRGKELDKEYDGYRAYIKTKNYYTDGTTANGEFYTDETYMADMYINPYKAIKSQTDSPKKDIAGRTVAGVRSSLWYITSTSADNYYSYYDISKYEEGGYLTLEYWAKGNSTVGADSNKQFFDDMYLVCYDMKDTWSGYLIDSDEQTLGNKNDNQKDTRNFVGVKLSDFVEYSNGGWNVVKVPLSAFTEFSPEYTYWKLNTTNVQTVGTPRVIDFSKFSGVGVAWIAPEDSSAITEDSDMNAEFNFRLGKISLDQVLTPEITKTEENGKLTLSWDAVNADNSFEATHYSDLEYTATGENNTGNMNSEENKDCTFVATQRDSSKYRKLFGTDTITEKISYSVYKNGKKVADTDETTYTADIGTRNATYYVVANAEKKFDQRRGWSGGLESAFTIKTLTLDSKPSNTVSVGASLDPDKNPRVFDLYVNGRNHSYNAGDYQKYQNYDLDISSGEFNRKYEVTADYSGLYKYVNNSWNNHNVSDDLYGWAYWYGNNGNGKERGSKTTTIDGSEVTVSDRVARAYVYTKNFETNTWNENLKKWPNETELFNDNLLGMTFLVRSTANDDRYGDESILDLSEVANTATLDFELNFETDAAQIRNNLYVMVQDGKNATNYLHINGRGTGNSGNAQKLTNYAFVKLSDFVDVDKLAKNTWTTVSVPLSVFSDETTTYNRIIRTRGSDGNGGTKLVEERPIDYKYFTGVGLVYISDGNETADGPAGGILLDNISIYNVEAPEVTAAYDAATNTTKLTWDMPNEGYVYYDLYKNGSLMAEDVENGTYTDSTPNVDAVYTVKARHTIDYATVNKYSASTSKQTISTETDKVSIDYADLSINDEGTKVTGTFNPGAEGVWIVIKFDKNFATVGDVQTETITASDNQQVKTADITVADGETVKSFFWSNLTDILPKADAAVYPKN